MRRSNKKNHDMAACACLAAIVIVGLVLAAYFYSGPFYTFDDGTYITYAHQILQSNFTINQNTPYKFGYLMPTLIAASFASFGVSPFDAVLPTLIEYVLLIVLAFLVGRTLFDNRVGLLGSALIVTMPFVFGYATRAIPDMLLGVIAGFALYALALGVKSKRHAVGFMAISGLVSGLAIFVKLGGIGLGIALLIAMFFLDRKVAPFFFAGFVISIGIYFMAFYLLSGGHLSYISSYSASQVSITQGSLSENITTFEDIMFGSTDISQIYPIGLLSLLIIIGTAIAFIRRNKRLIYLAFLFWSIFLYLFFGTESLSSYTFITVVDRYFIFISIPMALLGAHVLVEAYGWLAKHSNKWLAIFLLAAFMAFLVLSNMHAYTAAYNYNVFIKTN